jgi:lysophospholipase L1-like esterase
MNYFPSRTKRFTAFILSSTIYLGFTVSVFAQQAPATPTEPPKPVLKASVHRGLENPAALNTFFAQLDRVKRKINIEPLRIAHFGDSHVAADLLTAYIRRHFQADFGNGGDGLLIAKNPFSTPRRGVDMGTSGGWVVDGIGKGAGNDGAYGMAGISITAEKKDERIWVEATTNHFDVYVLKGPGSATIDVSVDGVSVLDRPMNLSSEKTSVEVIPYDTPLVGRHRLELRTVTPGRARILGIASEQIEPGAGVCYDVLGINGARASRVLGWNDRVLCDTLSKRSPDLIIVAYGTNEVTDKDWNIASYSAMFAGILKMFKRAAPKASIIVFGPPDRADNTDATSRMPDMLAAQRKAAKEAGAAFWCSYDAMGGAGAMDNWVSNHLGQPDHVHLTKDGYQRIGDMFYEDVKKAYLEWKTRAPTRTRRAG